MEFDSGAAFIRKLLKIRVRGCIICDMNRSGRCESAFSNFDGLLARHSFTLSLITSDVDGI